MPRRSPVSLSRHAIFPLRAWACVMALAASAGAAQAAEISLGLNDSAIEAGYTSAPVGQGLEYTAGAFHVREKGQDGDVWSLGLQLSQPVAPGVRAALGGKLLAAFNDRHDTAALALGGLVELNPNLAPMLHFGVHAWLAPGITSFGKSKSWSDLGVSIGYELIPQAQITLSYRNVRIGYDGGGPKTKQDAGLLGLKLRF